MNSLWFNKDRLVTFLEKRIITIFLSVLVFIFVLNKYLVIFNNKFSIKQLDVFLSSTIQYILIENSGTLISIAAVFIGIYFTVFTILSGFKTESTFAVLDASKFSDLVKYVRNAFVGSFVYLFFSLVFTLQKDVWIVTLSSLVLLIYMFLSAIRFAIMIYIILQHDINKYHEHLQKINDERNDEKAILQRLNNFLNEQERNKNSRKSQELNEFLVKRDSEKKSEKDN